MPSKNNIKKYVKAYSEEDESAWTTESYIAVSYSTSETI